MYEYIELWTELKRPSKAGRGSAIDERKPKDGRGNVIGTTEGMAEGINNYLTINAIDGGR